VTVMHIDPLAQHFQSIRHALRNPLHAGAVHI
jgi:hypothetical protein